jgi:hypothetical protein
VVIAAGTTGPMIATLKDAHNEQLRLFREVVEKALIQQIVKAIEPTYLASLRDRNSNSLRGTVNEILAHLQTTYGHISPQMMEDREQELITMVYNPKFPIDTIFNAVEDFSDYAELAQHPITAHQTIAKAYLLLNKTGPSPNGTVGQRLKRPGLTSRHTFAKPTKNSAKPPMSLSRNQNSLEIMPT